MNIEQIKNIYKANGLNNYSLRGTEDLKKVHGIDYIEIPGFYDLNDSHKEIFKKFIVNFYNAQGLEKRLAIIPVGVYFVEDKEYFGKVRLEDDYCISAKKEIFIINSSGAKKLLHHWEDEEYKGLKNIKSFTSHYLRFEYNLNNESKWVRILNNGFDWY